MYHSLQILENTNKKCTFRKETSQERRLSYPPFTTKNVKGVRAAKGEVCWMGFEGNRGRSVFGGQVGLMLHT